MPVITVEWLKGRSRRQKARLAHAMTQAFAKIANVPDDQVWVVFRDVKRSDWAMGGKLLGESSSRG